MLHTLLIILLKYFLTKKKSINIPKKGGKFLNKKNTI